MASSIGLNKLAFVVVMMYMVASAPGAHSITCEQVYNSLSPCLSYVKNGGAVSGSCCNGVKGLNSAARTTPDRQQACNCTKTLARSISGINYNLANTLPSKCGVNISYKIDPSIDCSRVR